MKINIRPQTFKDYIGQTKIKETLKVIINSSKKRKTCLDHILLFGKPGIGKTSLANVIATEVGGRIRYAQGPTLEKKADILSLIGSIQKNDIVFIDEIHGINKNIEEIIYSAVEDGVIDLAIGPDGDSKIVRLKLPSFTLIGATTKMNHISTALKSRFGIICKLKDYDIDELSTIVKNTSSKLNYDISKNAAIVIASHSMKNPRKANNIFRRCIDFAVSNKTKIVNSKITLKTLEAIGVYKYGLDDSHLDYLKILQDTFYEKWASLDNVSSIAKEEKSHIEQNIESPLLELGLIEKSSRGRRLTNLGIKFLTTYNLYNV